MKYYNSNNSIKTQHNARQKFCTDHPTARDGRMASSFFGCLLKAGPWLLSLLSYSPHQSVLREAQSFPSAKSSSNCILFLPLVGLPFILPSKISCRNSSCLSTWPIHFFPLSYLGFCLIHLFFGGCVQEESCSDYSSGFFFRLDALPVTQSAVTKHCRMVVPTQSNIINLLCVCKQLFCSAKFVDGLWQLPLHALRRSRILNSLYLQTKWITTVTCMTSLRHFHTE